MGYILENWTPLVLTIAITFFAILIISIINLRHNRALAEKLVFHALTFLLFYKLLGYIVYCIIVKNPWYEQIPVETSQIAYFLVPIAYLTQNKWIKDGAYLVGFIAGFIHLLSITVAPYRFVEAGNTAFEFFEATAVHYILFWSCAVEICCIERLEIKNIWKAYIIFGLILCWGALAGNTWMYGTDPGYPDAPANIGYTQRCDMLPDVLLERYPWLAEHHLFLVPFFVALLIVSAIIYTLSYLSTRNLPESEPSIYGMGWSGIKRLMKTDIIAPFEDK